MLPILTAPAGPSRSEVQSAAETAQFTGWFRRDLEGSDVLHWGDGRVFVSDRSVSLMGKIAPGPDYRLYLAPEFVETEADFLAIKEQSIQIGEVKTFENFIAQVPATVDVSDYNTVVIWCESFAQFITAAAYLPAT
jgi:hypothetical protein